MNQLTQEQAISIQIFDTKVDEKPQRDEPQQKLEIDMKE